jgi:hypothetical protein
MQPSPASDPIDIGCDFPRVKEPESEGYQLLPAIARVKYDGVILQLRHRFRGIELN